MSFNPFSLEGQRVLVTGASSGIGRQIAISCAQMGANVVVVGRDVERLNATLVSLDGSGHLAIPADLKKPEDLSKIAKEAGNLNGLVHAAGHLKLVPFRMINQKHLDDMFSTNVFAPLLLTKELLAKKQLATRASIVFIGAVAAEVGPIASAAYSGSKAALLGATRSLAVEVMNQFIRVNIISPGYVNTPMLDQLTNSGSQRDAMASMAPLGVGEPEDIAYAAVFYLSQASRWMTRTEFVIDGGLTTPINA